MTVTLRSLDPTGVDREALISFLTENAFPFHARLRSSREQVIEAIERGDYRSDSTHTYWLQTDDDVTIGFVRLQDLEDPTPIFDLRLGEAHRGRGLGRASLAAITEHVFATMPGVDRFEGMTRVDNTAMRRAFMRTGWVKEAHHRDAWRVEGADPMAAVGYGILRRDWERSEITPFVWDDLTL